MSINKYKKKIDNLLRRLHLDMNKIDVQQKDINNGSNMTLIEEENYYKDLFKVFEKIKNERKEKLLKLKQKEHDLCNLLNENSYTVNDGRNCFIIYCIFG